MRAESAPLSKILQVFTTKPRYFLSLSVFHTRNSAPKLISKSFP